MTAELLPIAVVIPTRNRTASLHRTLTSLAAQSAQPAEVVIVDASDDDSTRSLCQGPPIPALRSRLSWYAAEVRGAASQRNQGVGACWQYEAIGFFDDDIVLEPDCVARLWAALQSDARRGGVNALISNHHYGPPGSLSRPMFRFLAGRAERSYAGLVVGPAVNLLPADGDDLPEIVPVEWLDTCCALYRREALPRPPFRDFFTGYSLGEDLALSLLVGRQWRLANARTARVFHDSQPGSHKSDPVALAEMELFNRYYIMTEVLHRRSLGDHVRFLVFQAFTQASHLRTAAGRAIFPAAFRGRVRALHRIVGAS